MRTNDDLITLQVKPSSRRASEKYSVVIGRGALSSFPAFIREADYSSVVIISDTRVASLWADKVLSMLPKRTSVLTVPRGERQKTLKTAETLWKEFHKLRVDRHALVVNLGGGATLDLGGFVAGTYLRGLRFLNLPTTLLAQVDASIGGKVGINFRNTKNIVGSFSQPVGVICDQTFLDTLPERELRSGMAEMIKHGALFDVSHFNAVRGLGAYPAQSADLSREIARSCELKCAVVRADSFESGRRRLLNFGHTLGHAFEAISLKTLKPLLHGESVAIGMVVEAELAEKIGVAKTGTRKRIEEGIRACKLPTDLPSFLRSKPLQVLKKIKEDKKVIRDRLVFSLLSEVGNGIVVEDVQESSVKNVLTAFDTV